MATKIGNADLAQYFSTDAYIKRPKKGFVTSLGQEMPQLMYGATNYFDLSGDTTGKFVGETEAKNGEDIETPLRQVRTEKLVYDQRISEEAYNQLKENNGLGSYLQNLVNKFLGSDFERDLDNMVLYGKPSTSSSGHLLADYLTKSGSAQSIVATDATAANVDAAIAKAVASTDGDGIATNRATLTKLATINRGNNPKYPELGAFGVGGGNLAGLNLATSKAIGSQNSGKELAIVGDFNAIRWGIVANAPFKLLDSGNPDGKGDLANTNQYLIRLEIFFGAGIANPNALAVVATK